MTVLEMFTNAIKAEQYDVRVTCINRWMVMDETSHELVVYEKMPYKRNTYVICRTYDVEYAVSSLFDEGIIR